jgi:hypothetical protein
MSSEFHFIPEKQQRMSVAPECVFGSSRQENGGFEDELNYRHKQMLNAMFRQQKEFSRYSGWSWAMSPRGADGEPVDIQHYRSA